MPTQISIRLSSLALRMLLPAAALIFLLAFIFIFRWSVANSAATRANNKEIAELTTVWAPYDPQTHYTLALLNEKSFLPENLSRAVLSYEKAASLSPYDYRYWLPLAQARERSGDTEGGEKALRRALELAPNYAQIHWAMGNVLLRQDRTEEAFAEMKQALERNPAFAATAATTALQFSDEEPAALVQKLGNSSEVKAAMALALVRQKSFDDGINAWNSIPENERKGKFKERGDQLSDILLADKKFRYARQIKNPGEQNTTGKFSNPGFEQDLDLSGTSPFEWNIAEGAQPRIGFDERQKYEGSRSLGIVFPKGSGKEFRAISQTVIVEKDTSYRLTVFFRSEIISTGNLRWEIADAASGDVLAATKDISGKSDSWQMLSADFKTAAQTEAVIVRFVRTGCQNCSVEGKLWFDDFSLISGVSKMGG